MQPCSRGEGKWTKTLSASLDDEPAWATPAMRLWGVTPGCDFASPKCQVTPAAATGCGLSCGGCGLSSWCGLWGRCAAWRGGGPGCRRCSGWSAGWTSWRRSACACVVRFVPCAATLDEAVHQWNHSPTDSKTQMSGGQMGVHDALPRGDC